MRVTTKERIAAALADGPRTAEEILAGVGIDCLAALRRMVADEQVRQDGKYYRLP